MAPSRQSSGLRRANDPPLLILISLAEGPKHGHALAKDIEDFAEVKLGPGEPLDSDDRRRPYQITGAGSAALAGALADMRRVTSTGLARLRLQGHLA